MSNDDRSVLGRKPGSDPSGGEISPAERAEITKRAADIGAKIESAKQRHTRPVRSDSGRNGAMARGLKISAELIGGVVVGAGIGWFLDRSLNTFPWLFIVFFLLGSAAGMLNIVRQAQREVTPPAPSVSDDEDEDK